MKIDLCVIINESQQSKVSLECPDNMISLYWIEQLVSDFVSDRLITAGYPKMRKEGYENDGTSKIQA